MSAPILDVKNLTVDFGGVRAVNNISFAIQPGEFIGLIGPNGAGKTTVFNLITNSIRATSGEILFKDKSILGKSPDQICRLGISRTFQNIRLFPQMSAYEHMKTWSWVCTIRLAIRWRRPSSARRTLNESRRIHVEEPMNCWKW